RAGCNARPAPGDTEEIPVPLVVAGIAVEAVERIPYRIRADERVVGDHPRGPHVGMVGAPAGWVAVNRTPPRRAAGDSDRNQGRAPHAVNLGRALLAANTGR